MYGSRSPGGCEGRGGRYPRRSGRSAGKPLGRACVLLPLSLLSLFGFLSVPLLLAPRLFPRKHVGRLFRAVASLPPSAKPAVIGNFQRLTVGTSSTVPHPGRALGCSPESTQRHKVFVRVFGLRMY